MDINRLLPALVTSAILLAVLGVAGLLALAWTDSPQTSRLIRRALVVLLIAATGGPLLYWFATWAVEGGKRHEIDRSLQEQQQNELQQRLKQGGH